MRFTALTNQATWKGTNRTWYVRNDSVTRKALAIAAKTSMTTEPSMIQVLLSSQMDVWAESVPQTVAYEEWERMVRKTLGVLFDPDAIDYLNAPAECESYKLALDYAIRMYIVALNEKRRDAIADGTYRLGTK